VPLASEECLGERSIHVFALPTNPLGWRSDIPIVPKPCTRVKWGIEGWLLGFCRRGKVREAWEV
jgi:hypothetical protein